MNYRGDSTPKIPSVGDIYIFSYAHTLKFAAKVTKVTDKTVAFHQVKINMVEKDTSSMLESYYCWTPLEELAVNGEHKFSARKTSFGKDGNVNVSHHDAYGWPWDGTPVKETHYH
jgi:hypothetical protein